MARALLLTHRLLARPALCARSAAVAFLVGPVIVLVVGLTLLGSRQVAGLAMSVGGAALALVGLACSGHSTTRLVRMQRRNAPQRARPRGAAHSSTAILWAGQGDA